MPDARRLERCRRVRDHFHPMHPGARAARHGVVVALAAAAVACENSAAPLTASKLAFTVQPSSSVSRAAIAPAIQVVVQDGAGNPFATYAGNVTIAIGANPGSGALTGTATVSAIDGVASFTGLSIDKAGTGYTLTAASTGLTSATSTTFDITADTATHLVYTVQPTSVVSSAAITPAVQVTARDAAGNTATGFTGNVTVALGANAAVGTLSGPAMAAAAGGVATFSGLSVDKAGTGYTLTAESSGLTGATSTAFTVTHGTATKLAFGVQPGDAAAGDVMAPAVTAIVQDAAGNTVLSAATVVTLGLGANEAGGALSGTATRTAENGVASFSDLVITKAGSNYTLAAAAPSLTGALSSPFTVTPGAVDTVTVLPATSPMLPDQTVQLSARLADRFGNVVTGRTVTWLSTGPSVATVSSSGLVTAVATGRTTVVASAETKSGTALVGVMAQAGFSTPTVDGTMDTGEWNGAATFDFNAALPQGGGEAPASLFVLNDGVNLYFAVRVARSSPDSISSMDIEFDNDGDGLFDSPIIEEGDDILVTNAPQGAAVDFYDSYRTLRPPCPAASICGFGDTDDGGTTDGSGGAGNNGVYTVLEMAHPLDTTDDAHDFSLTAGQSVGIKLALRMIANPSVYPYGFGDTTYPAAGFVYIQVRAP